MRRISALLATTSVLVAMSPAAALAAPSVAAIEVAEPVITSWLDSELAAAAVTDTFLVMVHGEGDLAATESRMATLGFDLAPPLHAIDVAAGIGTRAQIVALAGSDGITRIEGDQPAEYYLDTSHVATRGAEAAASWTDAAGNPIDGSGISIAIVDSGVDGTHPMFTDENGDSKVVVNKKYVCPIVLVGDSCFADAPTNNTDSASLGGHGTHVASTAGGYARTTEDGRSVAGAATGADIVAISGGAVISMYAAGQAMQWVVDHHADPCGDGSCNPIKVVNNSWGTSDNGTHNASDSTALLAKKLVDEGVVVVWAAGNDGGDGTTATTSNRGASPQPGVIMVANYDDANSGARDNAMDSSSSAGQNGRIASYPDIMAPGSSITAACRPELAICRGLDTDPDYGTISGTSMAAPHIAGIVAQLFQADPTLTPGEVERVLLTTAYKSAFGDAFDEQDTRFPGTGTTSWDKGHGLVNVVAALESILGDGETPDDVCTTGPLLTDPADDAGIILAAGGGIIPAPSLDIIEADLATDPATGDVLVTVQVTDLSDTPPPGSVGEWFDIQFSVQGKSIGIIAQRNVVDGESFDLADWSDGRTRTTVALDGTFDDATSTIRITLHASALVDAGLGALLADGDVFSAYVITSRRDVGGFVPDADFASTICTYALGQEHTTPVVTIADAEVAEGDDGTTTALLTLTLDEPATATSTVEVTVSGGTATLGTDADDPSATVTFAEGEFVATLPITVHGDTEVEDDETIEVLLGAASGIDVGTPGMATLTILDDDVAGLAIDDISMDEGNTNSTISFRVHLDRASNLETTFTATTEEVTATAGDDFTAVTVQGFIPAGETETTVTVDIVGDLVEENDEVFLVLLSDVTGSGVADGMAYAELLDDDALPDLGDDCDDDNDDGDDGDPDDTGNGKCPKDKDDDDDDPSDDDSDDDSDGSDD